MKTKFGVSLDHHLLLKFDQFVEHGQFSNRSEAISHLIKEKLKERFVAAGEEDAKAFAVVSICFDHHKRVMGDILTKVQHNYLDIISSSLHVHVDEHNCAELVICTGPKKRITDFYHEISQIRGLVNHHLNFIYNHNIHQHDENAHEHDHEREHEHERDHFHHMISPLTLQHQHENNLNPSPHCGLL